MFIKANLFLAILLIFSTASAQEILFPFESKVALRFNETPIKYQFEVLEQNELNFDKAEYQQRIKTLAENHLKSLGYTGSFDFNEYQFWVHAPESKITKLGFGVQIVSGSDNMFLILTGFDPDIWTEKNSSLLVRSNFPSVLGYVPRTVTIGIVDESLQEDVQKRLLELGAIRIVRAAGYNIQVEVEFATEVAFAQKVKKDKALKKKVDAASQSTVYTGIGYNKELFVF